MSWVIRNEDRSIEAIDDGPAQPWFIAPPEDDAAEAGSSKDGCSICGHPRPCHATAVGELFL